jgi:uncharacterized protein (DUF58 family)
MENPHLLSPELMVDLKRLELRSRRSVDSDLMGQYRSSFKGSGLIFSDLRSYAPGDDIKHIHWKATARTGKPFVKTYQEERQLKITLAVDISASTLWGAPKSKHTRALEFAGLLTILAQKNQDSVGLCLFDENIVEYIKPSSKRSQFQRILRALMDPRPLTAGTNINAALSFLQNKSPRSEIIFVVSDFLTPSFIEPLRALSFRNDVIGVSLISENEDILPSAGLIEIKDAESGEEFIIDTSAKKTRIEMLEAIKKQIYQTQSQFASSKADFIQMTENPLRPLIDLMKQRSRRIK